MSTLKTDNRLFYSTKSLTVGMENPEPWYWHGGGGGQDAKLTVQGLHGLFDDQGNSELRSENRRRMS